MSIQKRKRGDAGPEWVAVYITHSHPEAHIVLGKLRAHDLPAMLHQEAGAAALGITYGNLGEVKILVAPADVARAEALIYADHHDQIEASSDRIQVICDDDE